MSERKCLNCGAILKHGESGHFAPPCFGEEGFFICDKKEADVMPLPEPPTGQGEK